MQRRILEAALICSQEAPSLRELSALFEGALSPDTLRRLLAELQRAWEGRGVELVCVASGWRFQSRPGARRLPSSACAREAATLQSCRARDAGDHRLPPAGHARRHGGDPAA